MQEIIGALLARVDASDRHLDANLTPQHALRAEINTFIANPNRMLLIVGPPGVGKTAFLTRLVRENQAGARPYLGHFCQLADGINPLECCRALGDQLRALLGDDYQLPTTARPVTIDVDVNVTVADAGARVTGLSVGQINLGDIHPREAFRTLVREPLIKYATTQTSPPAPLVIVIDALDLAWEWDEGQGASIVNLLGEVQDLPPWVNIICTARPGRAVQALRTSAGVRLAEIDPLSDSHTAEMTAYFTDWQAGLDHTTRDRLIKTLLTHAPATAEDTIAPFIAQAAVASRGNFRYARAYTAALQTALTEAHGAQLDVLLAFSQHGSLTASLDESYATTLASVRDPLNPHVEAVLLTLALVFDPLNRTTICYLTTLSIEQLAATLEQLAPVIREAEGQIALFHPTFADYVRQGIADQGRARDLAIARTLETLTAGDAGLRAYANRYRRDHLLRATATPVLLQQTSDWRDTLAQVERATTDAVTRAQVLRTLAGRALDPSQVDVAGSWSAALEYLHEAETGLRQTRALRRRAALTSADASAPEVIELERTLIARGDACASIAQRLDTGQRIEVQRGFAQTIFALFGLLVRMPLALFLLVTLIRERVREIQFPGALQNLGRDQDWIVARLHVQSIGAYRRALTLAARRGDEQRVDEIAERLARSYKLMGAFDAALAQYEKLIARPGSGDSSWRQALLLQSIGEVLLAQGRPDRAVEMLTNALPTFDHHQSPVLRARALGELAVAYARQASAAARRHDDVLTQRLDDLTIAGCGEAITAWRGVTALRDDDGQGVDPDLAIAGLLSELRGLDRTVRVSDDQRRAIAAQIGLVPEQHFGQRFEHPLPRVFRVVATVVLPLYLILGTILAVTPPPTYRLDTAVAPVVQSPYINLSQSPALTASWPLPDRLEASALRQLASKNPLQVLQSKTTPIEPPTVDLVQRLRDFLLWVGLYLVLYLLIGLWIIVRASLRRFQRDRPGRYILTPTTIIRRGALSAGAFRDLLAWLTGGDTLRRLWRKSAPQTPGESTLAYDAIGDIQLGERRALGLVLGDFSQITIQPQVSAPAWHVSGTVLHFADLAQELARRVPQRMSGTRLNLTGGIAGLCLVLTGLLAAALLVLRPALPEAFAIALLAGYTISDSYVFIAAGLLLPICWWLLVAPLLGRRRDRISFRLLGSALLATLLALPVGRLLLHRSLDTIDLLGPLLALLLAAAVIAHTRPRSTLVLPQKILLVRTILLLAMIPAVAAGSWRTASALIWYDGRLRGDAALRAGFASKTCGDACDAVFAAAERHFSTMICIRPERADGYVARATARFSRGQLTLQQFDGSNQQTFFDQGVTDLERARAIDENRLPETVSGCDDPLPGFGPPPRDPVALVDRASARVLYGDLNLSRITGPGNGAQAAAEFTTALADLTAAYNQVSNQAVVLDTTVPDQTCNRLMTELAQPQETMTSRAISEGEFLLSYAPQINNREQLATIMATTRITTDEQAAIARRMGDVCYKIATARLDAAIASDTTVRERANEIIWYDLNAASVFYSIVLERTGSNYEQQAARRGLGATWLLLGQLAARVDTPDPESYFVRAQGEFQALAASQNEVSDLVGKAWSLILIGGWADARTPLFNAIDADLNNPTYRALAGLAEWLETTRQTPGEQWGSYERALMAASARYTQALTNEVINQNANSQLADAHATRSVIAYTMRNSPHDSNDTRDPGDYRYWMQQAIADAVQAKISAEDAGLQPADRASFNFWLGHLQFNLALAQQSQGYGSYSFASIGPLYAEALHNFEQGAAATRLALDTAREAADQSTITSPPSALANTDSNAYQIARIRQLKYDLLWIPWVRQLAANASALDIAQTALRDKQPVRARAALELVLPEIAFTDAVRDALRSEPEAVQSEVLFAAFDADYANSMPTVEYLLLYGQTSLALGMPEDFKNLVFVRQVLDPGGDATIETGNNSPYASYTQAIETLFVQTPDAARYIAVLRAARTDLAEQLKRQQLTPAARRTADDLLVLLDESIANAGTPPP